MPVADITVVFPYYNEAETIRTTLDLMSRQTLMPREVYFVNSSSTDGSARIVDDWIAANQPRFETKFHNVSEGTNTPSSSKNVGIRRAACDWVAFMDCGQRFPEDWLERQWAYVRSHPEVDLVSGGCVMTGEGLIDQSAVAMTSGYKAFRPCVPTSLVKKTVFDKTGPFRENRRAGYDASWASSLARAGVRRGINEDVVIRYLGVNYADSLSECFSKAFRYAVPMVGLPGCYTPYAYLAPLVVAASCCALHPRSFGLFLGAYVLFRGYYYPARKSRGFALIKERKLALLTLPLTAIVIDAGRMLGYIKGIIVEPWLP